MQFVKTLLLPAACCGALLLTSCDTRRPTQPTTEPAAPATPVTAAARPAAPDTADLTRSFDGRPGPLDSLIAIGARHYRLSVTVATDSTRPLDYAAAEVGPAFAAPGDSARRAGTVRGYAETYTFTLRDSLRRTVVFRRQLRKPDFYKVAPREVVTVMNMAPPSYLGYSRGLDALAFACYLDIPYSDVGYQAVLLLDRQGRVQHLSPAVAALSGAADCAPRISPSGRAVLTCAEVLRAGRPPLPLTRPHAELQAALFLNDSTLLTVYQHGDYVPRPDLTTTDSIDANVTAPMSPYEFVSTPAQRRLPTAYILSTSGRVLRSFRLRTSYTLSAAVPRVWVRPAHTLLLVESGKKVVIVPQAHPERLNEMPLKELPKFKPPLRPHEQRYEVFDDFNPLWLYVDTLQPTRLRYQLKPAVE